MADGLGPGTLFLPGIEDLHEIGRGGSATLYRGRQAAFNRDVAVKVLDAVDDSGAARFSKELRAIGSLSGHHHVVPVYEAGELDRHPYLVMPYLGGGSLADRLRSGPLPPADVTRIGLAVADALAAAHGLGMLHRDVKPANVLFNAYGEAQLADFGIARFSDATLTQGLITATVGYAAPEVLAGEPASPAADVYSLGATLHAALRGEPPYVARPDEPPLAFALRVMQDPPPPLEGPPPGAAVPTALAAVVSRAMAKDPAARFPTASAMAAALAEAAAAPPAAPPPPPAAPTEQLGRPLPAPRRPGPDGRLGPVAAGPAVAGPAGGRGARRRVAPAAIGLLALLGAIAAVAVLLTSGSTASRSSSRRSSTAPAATAPATTTPVTTGPATTNPPPATTVAPTTTPTTKARAPQPAPAPSPGTTAAPPAGSSPAQEASYVRSYYNLVDAHSLAASWSWLSPSYQDRLGYSYYQHFWNSVRTVQVLGVSPGSGQATVTLRYDMANGTTSTERALLSFVTANGHQLISDTKVVG